MMHRRFSFGFCCASLLFLTIAVLVVISPAPDREQAEFGPPTLPEQPRAAYPKATEVSFEPNRGQTDPRVEAAGRGAQFGGALQLRRNLERPIVTVVE